MTNDIVIRAEGLGKKYLIGHQADRASYVALRDVLARAAAAAWRKTTDLARGREIVAGDSIEEFWALRDINFEVKRGEVLGVIGRNGAGKSTLLKILSRITDPSEGRVTIGGRVASLLEVGTGFHNELTGRENVYLNGAILGMTRNEVTRKFDEIVAFSEVENFLDTPVKRYSSGMYVRLAFAVAAHLEPDILIVDEVLAVGDTEFQKKCLGKINDVAHSGRTVLFVSHNLKATAKLCTHGLLLAKGRVLADGTMQSVISAYAMQTGGGGKSAANVLLDRSASNTITGDEPGLVTRVEMLNQSRQPIANVTSYSPVIFRVSFTVHTPVCRASVIIMLKLTTGATIAKFETNPKHIDPLLDPGTYHVDCCIDHLPLAAGHYFLGAGLAIHGIKMLDWVMGEQALTVLESDDPELEMSISPDGPLVLRHRWEAAPVDRQEEAVLFEKRLPARGTQKLP
jgi:lipopolysaccharide transport system ATP-binding protein